MLPCCHDRRLIGEILVAKMLITAVQLDEALRVQRSDPAKPYIGEVLMSLGHVSEVDVVTALVLQCNLPFIAVSKHTVDVDVLKVIPAEVARRDRIIPFDRIGCVLSVVMQNPMNDDVRERIERMTNCKVATFISTRAEIDSALTRFYGEGN